MVFDKVIWTYILCASGEIQPEFFRNAFGNVATDFPRFIGPPDAALSRLVADQNVSAALNSVYDYIIIGAGGAGCPLARTLADAGNRVLLLERGKLREHHPLTWSLDGAGRTFNDKAISQPILTEEGVVTHVGNVVGGGTSVNFGFYVEDFDFINQLRTRFGIRWNAGWFRQAQKWVRSRVSSPSWLRPIYSDAIKNFLSEDGLEFAGHSTELKNGAVWHGSTIFDSDHAGFRRASDMLLGGLSTFPATLKLVTGHKVQRILFDTDRRGDPAARCVQVRRTVASDTAPISSRPNHGVGIADKTASFIKWLTGIPLTYRSEVVSNPESQSEEAITLVCLDPENARSEIILAAGAIYTPWLLFHSGVGPVSEIEKLNVPLVKEIPSLGQNLIDRPFVPLIYFLDNDTAPVAPAVVQYMAFQALSDQFAFTGDHGSDRRECDGVFRTGSKNGKCGAWAYEEISGGRLAEGAGLSTRFFFPPRLRGSPIVDLAMTIMSACGRMDEQAVLGPLLGELLCTITRPVLQCLQKAAAHVILLSEPRSRGAVTVGHYKNIHVAGRYLENEYDLNDTVRGVAYTLRKLSTTNSFDGILERIDSVKTARELLTEKCPIIVRTHLSELLYTIGDTWEGLVSHEEVRDVEQSLEEDLKFNTIDAVRAIEERVTMAAEAFAAGKVIDVINGSVVFLENDSNRSQNLTDFVYNYPLNSLKHHTENSEPMKREEFYYERLTKQKYLSFPPTLPDPQSYEEIKAFVKRQMTSMWHWHGSSSKAVDESFRIRGLKKISIVDASVLPTLPRMNPQAAVMALGRYGGLVKSGLKNRDILIS